MFFAPTLHNTRYVPRTYDRRLERLVNDAFFGVRHGVQFEQDDKSWTLSLDVPGLTREDLEIGIEGAIVRISTRNESKRQVKAAYELPQDIDVEASEAKLENGVLTLKLGKQAPVNNVKALTIN